MKKTLTAVLLSLTLAAPVMAKDIAGVKYPDTATVAGKELGPEMRALPEFGALREKISAAIE